MAQSQPRPRHSPKTHSASSWARVAEPAVAMGIVGANAFHRPGMAEWLGGLVAPRKRAVAVKKVYGFRHPFLSQQRPYHRVLCLRAWSGDGRYGICKTGVKYDWRISVRTESTDLSWKLSAVARTSRPVRQESSAPLPRVPVILDQNRTTRRVGATLKRKTALDL